jgi:hypothetical protein
MLDRSSSTVSGWPGRQAEVSTMPGGTSGLSRLAVDFDVVFSAEQVVVHACHVRLGRVSGRGYHVSRFSCRHLER